MLLGSLFLIPVIAVAALPGAPLANKAECGLQGGERFDCYPEPGVTRESCEARGCCFNNSRGVTKIPMPGVPTCFYPSNYAAYRYLNVSNTDSGKVAFLQQIFESAYPRDVGLVRMDVEYQTEYRLRIKISDAETARYETPYPKITKSTRISGDLQYQVDIDDRLGFRVRRSSGETLFDTVDLGGFLFSDLFLQISSRYFGQMYGLGEHRSTLWLPAEWSRFTIWNASPPLGENVNLYGSHPFYMVVEPNGATHGVYLHNSNGIDFLLQPLDAVTIRAIGGVFDFYFFMGPTPGDVIRQYTELIGRPYLPPYWSLGFHLCRYGYDTTNKTRETWQRTRDAGIPFDAQWTDIDMMINSNDFTVDPVRFAGIEDHIKEIHEVGQHFVTILDPGVSASEPAGTYSPYDEGLEMDVFVKHSNDSILVGHVWNPESTVFVDFSHPKALEYWTLQARKLHEAIKFDGLWIDMNEPCNFVDGSLSGCPDDELEHPQYYTGAAGDLLSRSTFCMTAKQHAGVHYNVHNLYSIYEAEVTNLAVQEVVQKRPFVLSRSTFAGSGAYTAHWSGDNYSSWYDLGKSVFEILSLSLFGISHSGADICGHNRDATPEICSRWMQLGAFYSFSRTHNYRGAIDQDPVAMGELVVNSSVKALTQRYTLLPYLYTLMYKASVDGDTVARPLFFEFPRDTNTHKIDTAFLWGPGLYIIPVLDNTTSVSSYLPEELWYDWYTGVQVPGSGEFVEMDAPLDTIPLLVRGGHVLPTQAPAMTTTESRKNGLTFLAAADENGSAQGDLYWDDGDSINPVENKRYGLLKFEMGNEKLTSSVEHWYNTPHVPTVESVKILGVAGGVQYVQINGDNKDFHQDTNILQVTNIKLPLNTSFSLQWFY